MQDLLEEETHEQFRQFFSSIPKIQEDSRVERKR